MSAPVISLLSDFGVADAYPGIMKGVILGICPQAQLVDLTHAVPPQQVAVGALLLRAALPFFPPGSVHLAVVDPGVGSGRHALVVETEKGILVGPDNGLLLPAAAALGRFQVHHADNEEFFRRPVSQTFHGRDVFAPVAAHVALGVPVREFGPTADSWVELPLPAARRTPQGVQGEVVHVDHFGNLITNIGADLLGAFPPDRLSVSIATHRVAGPVTAYASVEQGALLSVVGSWGFLEIAVRNGDAAKTLAAAVGTPVTVVAN